MDDPPYQETRYMSVFQETEALGSGGFGTVVSSKYLMDGQNYAIKKVPVGDGGDYPKYEDAVREVRVHSLLKNPYIVQYHTAWFEPAVTGLTESSFEVIAEEIEGCLYIQQELCKRTLSELIGVGKCGVEYAEGYRIFLEILEGVSYIHSQGIVHGDLTPHNIFLDNNDRIKIGDFGLAKFIEGNELSEIGVKTYTAPEIPCRPDKKSDIFSLGIILYEIFRKFETGLEKNEVLKKLKNSGSVGENDNPAAKLAVKLVHREPMERPEIDWIRDQIKELSGSTQ